jgi:hypothetical protein
MTGKRLTKAEQQRLDGIILVPADGQKLPPELRGLKIEWGFLGSRLAVELLKKNENNRKPSPGRVSRYRGDMRRKRWMVNGDTIRLDENGNLLDGQQRSMAAAGLDEGEGTWTLLVRNLKSDVRSTIDVGRSRSFADELRSMDETYVGQLSAVVRRAFLWEVMGVRWDLFNRQASHEAMKLYLYGDDEQVIPAETNLLRWAAEQSALASPDLMGVMPPSTFGTMLYLTTLYTNKQFASDFWIDAFRYLDNIPKSHPAHRLRNSLPRLEENRRRDNPAALCFCIAAWNEYATGEWSPGSIISSPRGGWTPENMPTLLPRHSRPFPVEIFRDAIGEHEFELEEEE